MAHMHYTGTGKMHSFRGQLPSGEQERIRIQGSVGAVAWRINKLQIIGGEPGEETIELVLKIYREEQTTVDNTVNFADDELLAVAYFDDSSSTGTVMGSTIIFDNALFSRNLHVGAIDTSGSGRSCNYYIELEEVKVSAAGMAQLAVAAARRTA